MTLQPASVVPEAPLQPNLPASPTGNGHGPARSPGPNGSPSPAPSRLPRAKARSKTARLLTVLAALLIATVVGGSGWYYLTASNTVRNDLVTHHVGYEKLQITIVERGALESAENSDIVCRVKAGNKGSTVASTIKWVIDDGSQIKKGDLLMELDDSGLQEQLKTEKITLDQAFSAWKQAEEAYKIVESQNLSDVKSAEIVVELTTLDLEKYLKGDYLQTLKDIQGRILMSESDVTMQTDRSAWAARMLKKGYYTASQAESEESRMRSTQIALDKVKEELRVLEDYTKVRTIKDLESKIAEAGRALDRVKKQADAKLVQAETDRKTKKSIYEQEAARFGEIEDEIRKCVITSPQDGMVVYYVPEQSRYGSGSQQSIVAQGEPVREGQKLIRIPDLSKMLVNTKVHEAMVSRVRGEQWQPTGFGDSVKAGLLFNFDPWVRLNVAFAYAELRAAFRDKENRLLYGGQQAIVRIDAFPDRVLQGHVKSIGTVASQADWMSSDVKVYQTMVAIDEPVEALKPGMSAEVTILAGDVADHVLTIPVQAIVGTAAMGRERKCYVMTPQGTEERKIVIGLSNEKMAEVKEGLQEGDEVVQNPRVLMSEKDRAQLQTNNKPDFAKGKGKGKGDKGVPPAGFPAKGEK